jgi:hypothetical protein
MRLRRQIKGWLLLSEGEKATLAEIAQRLGRKALEELAAVAKPDTLLAWYRKLIANKFDGSKFRQRVGRPRIDEEAERLVVQMAKENPSWGYDRIVGALANLGYLLSDQTVGNILRQHGLLLLLRAISWKDFIRSHMEVSGGDGFSPSHSFCRCTTFWRGAGRPAPSGGPSRVAREISPHKSPLVVILLAWCLPYAGAEVIAHFHFLRSQRWSGPGAALAG